MAVLNPHPINALRLSHFLVLTFCFSSLFVPLDASRCQAKCSPHLTLPCSFGAFDKCIENNCKELCRKDGNRPMTACYCRGVLGATDKIEGTLRACFCAPSKTKKTLFMF